MSFTSSNIIELLVKHLKQQQLEELNQVLYNFIKQEKTKNLGITKTPVLFSMGKKIGKILQDEKHNLENFLLQWWKKSYNEKKYLVQGLYTGRETRLIMVGILHVFAKIDPLYVCSFITKIIDDIHDWETCDQLALRVVVHGLIKEEDHCLSLLEKWRNSANKWHRRLAVATIPPYIRAKKDQADFCLQFIDKMMHEKDKDVLKAIGWALREISKKAPEKVYRFLMQYSRKPDKNITYIIREGMKKLPNNQQSTLLYFIQNEN